MQKKLLTTTLASFLLLASLHAKENIEDDLGGFETEEVTLQGDDDLAGFGDETEETVVIVEESQEANNFSLSGNIAFKTAYGYKNHTVDNVDYHGFNQAQTALYLQADYKINSDWKVRVSGDTFYDAIYDLRNEPYNNDVLDTYQTQLRLDDTYIQGRLTHDLDIKVGRQIVVWGKSDSIRVTDVINPLDNRNPGMTDIEDLRLPTTMAKLDYYLGKWNLSAMVIAEARIFLEAAPYGEFFPVNVVFPTAPPQGEFFKLKQPATSWDNTQYAFAANGIFSGWDLSFYGADVYDSKWHLEGTNPQNAARVVSKIQMIGSALNIATGSWLFKAETAYVNGVRYNSTKDAKVRVDTLVGFDYMGISDTVLSAEFANRHIFDYETQMGSLTTPKPDYVDQNEYQTALRATRSFMNDSLNATVLLSMFGASWEYGGFTRIWVEYDIIDALNANFGFVDYLSGERPFAEAIQNNDRVFADITYSF
jgi:hypothetical protein